MRRALRHLLISNCRCHQLQLANQAGTQYISTQVNLVRPLICSSRHLSYTPRHSQVDKHGDGSSSNMTVAQATGDQDSLFETVSVEVASHDPAVLKSYDYFVTEAATLLDIDIETDVSKPPIFERNTLPKSRHVHGKYHKVQYERRTYFRTFTLQWLTGSTADTYLEYIQRNIPEGVAMKVTKTQLSQLPDYIKPQQPGKLE